MSTGLDTFRDLWEFYSFHGHMAGLDLDSRLVLEDVSGLVDSYDPPQLTGTVSDGGGRMVIGVDLSTWAEGSYCRVVPEEEARTIDHASQIQQAVAELGQALDYLDAEGDGLSAAKRDVLEAARNVVSLS